MFADGTCTTVFNAALWDEVRSTMRDYFVDIALYGWQFERFEWAWCQWLDANAAIDWTDERLAERVETILAANVTTANAKPSRHLRLRAPNRHGLRRAILRVDERQCRGRAIRRTR